MKLRNLFMILTLAVALGACDKEEEDANAGSVNCQTIFLDLTTELTALQAAQDKYKKDDSAENCKAYLTSIEKFVDKVELSVKSCDDPIVKAQLAAFDAGLAGWRTQITTTKTQCGS
jgi:hypothetical protein